ncbi:uncharacterized protein [Nicotiana sylvestris]|uniref:uncharacterized protein n=1 Tax=Nicotiana sylvestris TaxID=4096 RepID=UPI00388CA1A1
MPADKRKAYALRTKAARYCLYQGNLYRKMFGGPLARCLRPSQTEYVMREVHEGHCGNHAGGRLLVKTMIRAGYYWPKMEEEANGFMSKCDKCQRYGNNMNRPAELLHPVIAPWPFMKWGMDIVGPLPQAKEAATGTVTTSEEAATGAVSAGLEVLGSTRGARVMEVSASID